MLAPSETSRMLEMQQDQTCLMKDASPRPIQEVCVACFLTKLHKVGIMHTTPSTPEIMTGAVALSRRCNLPVAGRLDEIE